MAKGRTAMSKVMEILRLSFEKKLSQRDISLSINVGKTTVHDILKRAQSINLTSWPLPPELNESTLRFKLFPSIQSTSNVNKPTPDWNEINKELMKKGVTLTLLWEEYIEENPNGFKFSRFRQLYRKWEKNNKLVMRQNHKAGEKLFLDFSGKTIPWLDLVTGEVKEAQLFVATLGASNYTFAFATESQSLSNWIQAHIEALKFFNGTPEIWVPDNLKSGVNKACRYEPELNPTYRELAKHYNVAVIPARARKPKDKAKVETAVKLAQMWIIACLRKQTFTNITEVNNSIKPLLEKFNNKIMRRYGNSRKELFDQVEKQALLPLPNNHFEIAIWKKAKVNIDYHIEFEGSWYSVPYIYVGKYTEIKATRHCIDIFYQNNRIANHARINVRGRHSTISDHMPSHHKAHVEWDSKRIKDWAKNQGEYVVNCVDTIMQRASHPEQGFRSCLGILRLGQRLEHGQLNKACYVAIARRAISYSTIRSILQQKIIEKVELPSSKIKKEVSAFKTVHENIRGKNYYH